VTKRPRREEKFSFPLFFATVAATLAGLAGLVRWLLPAWWNQQFAAGPLRWLEAFLALSLLNCFVEYFFHRYVLHAAPVPLFRHFHRQHTLHHGLTNIVRRPRPGGGGYYVIENRFPIETPEQGEASFFPWYSLTVFALALTPALALLQWVLPAFPWILGGYAALATSIVLYEGLHSISHWPLETWEPLIEHRWWGRLWRPAYSFHLRHHAVPDCNESVSGWFGFPVADWLFRTCIIPKTTYAEGEAWDPEQFHAPAARWPIARLDLWVAARAARRRAARPAQVLPGQTAGQRT
jgi:hemolysin III